MAETQNTSPEEGFQNDSSSNVSLPAINDVTSITRNKHSELNKNYNSGRVIMACKVNRYCPIYRKFVVDNSIVLNGVTMESFPRQVLSNIGFVKGLPGIYLKERYRYLSNYLKVGNTRVESINDGLEEPDKSENYKKEQTFIGINSVFDNPYSDGPLTELAATKLGNSSAGRAILGYVRHNEETDNEETAGEDTLNKNPNEADDSNVLYIGNKAANPNNEKGIHWRFKKETPLFHGEDFFITFRKNTIATDFSNIKSKKFLNKDYEFLDVLYEPSNDVDYPKNAGLVQYRREIDESGNTVKWRKNEDDMKNYDFNKQSYYVIEVGPWQGDHLFIIIPQKTYPRAILKKRDGRTYFLGDFKTLKGGALINSDKWTITVRNHLGSLVIYFDGDTENPWILDPVSISEVSKKDENGEGSSTKSVNDSILEIPTGNLCVWGGNISSSFCFSPLCYVKNNSVTFPPQPKTDAGVEGDVEINKYQLPLKGTKLAAVTASNDEYDLDSSSIVKPPQDGGTDGEEDSIPLYYMDSQFLLETSFNIDGESVEAEDIITSHPTHFLDTGRFLKATSPYTNPGEIVKKPGGLLSDALGTLGSFLGVEMKTIGYGSGISLVVNEESIKIDDNKESFSFLVELVMTAGDHLFSSGWHLKGCKTPIITSFRLIAIPKKDVSAWEATELDVSSLVMNYSESYSSPDFQSIQHTGNIKFLLNKGLENGLDGIRQQLEAMQNRAFYIEVWVGYENCNYSQLEPFSGYKLFTGICYGGTIEEKAGERVMSCSISDYSKILQESYIFNSHFWDGVRDNVMMAQLMDELGFRREESNGDYGPNYLVSEISKQNTSVTEITSLDGRSSYSEIFALPNSYDRLRSPFFKFKDGTPYWNAMTQVCKKAGKVMFFDTYGMLHYENLPYDKFIFGGGDGSEVEPLWYFTRYPWGEGQLVFNTMTRERSVNDVINVIHIVTSTPERELVYNDRVNWESLYDSDSPGFLGYKKVFLQQDGIFGNIESIEKISDHYSKFFKAPIVYKWESYGLPMRSLDVVDIDGQKIIVTSVSTEIDPARNVWWQTCEGEWYGSEETIKEPDFKTNNG